MSASTAVHSCHTSLQLSPPYNADPPPFSLQAVEELLESLDLEKSSYHMGLSRVSLPAFLLFPASRSGARPKLCAAPHPSGLAGSAPQRCPSGS